MTGRRQPLPPPQPPKPTRPNFRNQFQKKRKRPADDEAGGNGSNNGSRAPGDRRPPKAKKQKQQARPKRQEDGGAGGDDGNDGAKPSDKPGKKKSGGSGSRNAVDEADLDYDLGLNRAVARMDAAAAAAYLARQTKRYGSDLSEVELADLGIGPAAIQDTSSYGKDRTLDNLVDFLEAMTAAAATKDTSVAAAREALLAAPKANGAPHTIVVTGAGLRAADLVRAVRPLQTKTSTMAKLFAKHIKLAEAVAFLQSHRTGIAVGTPARLMDLLANGALSVAHLRRIVVDASHIDQKKRGVLDMQDTALPVARWLARPEFKARYGAHDGGADGGSADSSKPLSILFY